MVSTAGFFLIGHFLREGGARQYSITDANYKCTEYASKSPEEIVAGLSLEQKAAGLFEDPFLEKTETKQKNTGSLEYRKVAEKLVEESLVLLKNDSEILPLKDGTKVYITGPAADDASA